MSHPASTIDATVSETQRATIAAIRSHHDQMARTVADHTSTIQHSVDQLRSASERRRQLVEFATTELLPHAYAEEESLYRAGEELPHLRPLVRAMTAEHVLLRDLASQLAEATTQGEIVGAAAALSTLFHAHLEKENDLLLPALAEAGTDLASLLAGMHEILGEPESATQEHQCACGGHGGPENGQAEREAPAPSAAGELDLRALPHAERHARIFATFEGLPAGEGFTLVNDHDPKPLRHQFADRYPGQFTWDYLEAGPRVWRVRIGRS